MEALLDREADVENWNDERLDELSQRMDAGFKETREGFVRVDREMKEGFARVDRDMKEGFARLEQAMKEGFEKVDKRFEQVDKRFEQVDKRFEQVDDRFEVLIGRFFGLMIAILLIGGGMISTLIAALV